MRCNGRPLRGLQLTGQVNRLTNATPLFNNLDNMHYAHRAELLSQGGIEIARDAAYNGLPNAPDDNHLTYLRHTQ